MRELPDGFKFHQGVDGLIVGFSIVFLVRLEMVVSSFIDWQLIPDWSYEPILAAIENMKASLASMANSFSGPIGIGPGGVVVSIWDLLRRSRLMNCHLISRKRSRLLVSRCYFSPVNLDYSSGRY